MIIGTKEMRKAEIKLYIGEKNKLKFYIQELLNFYYSLIKKKVLANAILILAAFSLAFSVLETIIYSY